MTLVIVLAVFMILVGFIRALRSREVGDAPDETGDEEGFDAEAGDAPGDDAPPEDPDRVSAPPWEAYPDSQWELRDAKPAIWLGEASPTMMEMFKRVPEAEPDAPADGWVMPEPDPALMENPEDYGIDNGDPNTPMWTPPESPSAAAQPEGPRKGCGGIAIFWTVCAVRIVFDALYLLQRVLMLQGGGNGSFSTDLRPGIPGSLETMVVAAGALILMDILVLALITRRSGWIRVAFPVYVLFDLGLRAMDIINGFHAEGQPADITLMGVALAAAYDLVCIMYILRPRVTLEASG